MANKNINVLLKLVDKFTRPLESITINVKKQEKAVNTASRAVTKFENNATKKFKKIAKVSAGAATALGGFALKKGMGEALDLEGYRVQLETATKDTKKAADIMKYSIDLANRTPFEGGQLVEGAAKFEAMGLSAEKWLTYAGDMAAATNKDFDQSVEAIIDAQAGELERLKEFGIKKSDILAKGEEMFAGVQIANNNGQIVNQEKFNEAMLALMEDRFTGGMVKQSKTVRGMMSTVSGIVKNTLASIVGMGNDGMIKEGSALDVLRTKLGALSDKLVQMQQDGTIQAIADKSSSALGVVAKVVTFLISHADALVPVIAGIGASMGALTAVKGIGKAAKSFKSLASTVNNVAMSFSAVKRGVDAAAGATNAMALVSNVKLLAIVAVIGLVVAAIVFLVKNWDTIKAVVKSVCDAVVGFIGDLKAYFVNQFSIIKEKVTGSFTSMKTTALNAFNAIKEKVDAVVKKIKDMGRAALDAAENIPGVGRVVSFFRGHATGTPYFAGGPTRINEGGRGEIVDLPNGTRIIPHDVSKKSVGGGSSITVNLTVQGNVIGNRAFMEQTGSYIANKILDAQGVV